MYKARGGETQRPPPEVAGAGVPQLGTPAAPARPPALFTDDSLLAAPPLSERTIDKVVTIKNDILGTYHTSTGLALYPQGDSLGGMRQNAVACNQALGLAATAILIPSSSL